MNYAWKTQFKKEKRMDKQEQKEEKRQDVKKTHSNYGRDYSTKTGGKSDKKYKKIPMYIVVDSSILLHC